MSSVIFHLRVYFCYQDICLCLSCCLSAYIPNSILNFSFHMSICRFAHLNISVFLFLLDGSGKFNDDAWDAPDDMKGSGLQTGRGMYRLYITGLYITGVEVAVLGE